MFKKTKKTTLNLETVVKAITAATPSVHFTNELLDSPYHQHVLSDLKIDPKDMKKDATGVRITVYDKVTETKLREAGATD